ncbi:hypothetical protein NX801_04250 [Streptomyces sp. LP05-1]|uniref:Integral membrane protein n=1 Tax=Streptomyces pyxinae TaxID=2970734 RepID=A0ABT2CBX8_9ACTN|nr:hypothetical protein [Streptomyces sp. LP05-1]MCS0634883.1 hypothetical protein [Streptomyces sp. LP05-1]
MPRPRARKTAPHPDGRQGDTLALRLVPAPEPDRSPAVAELAHELADRIAPAVHAYEVAAVLESEGLTGERIRQRYGHPNLFSLAAELYRLVPRTYPEPPVPADPWRPDHVRCALRGALFALPGLAFPLTAPLWEADGRSVPGLVAAALVSWAWGQAVGHRAYLRLATGRREAGRALLTGAPLGAVLASLAALLVAGPGPAALIAVGQSVYLAAAGVLLVLGRERVLLASLGPLAAGAVALPWWDPGPLLRTGLPLLTVAAATGAAGWAVRGTLREPAVPGDVPPGYLGSLPYGLFGLAAGVLVLCAGQDRPYAVVALTLSMGPAEWLLYRFRGLAVRALLASSSARGFTLRCARALGLCLGGYLLPLLPAALLTGTDPGALVALGATLWTALLLQAFGIAWPPALAALAAACGTALAALTGRPPGPLLPVICCTAAAGVLVVLVLRRLGSPAAHA